MSGFNEQQVRALRDQVFEQSSTDNNWTACREGWLRPDSVEWLQWQIQKRTGTLPLVLMEVLPHGQQEATI